MTEKQKTNLKAVIGAVLAVVVVVLALVGIYLWPKISCRWHNKCEMKAETHQEQAPGQRLSGGHAQGSAKRTSTSTK